MFYLEKNRNIQFYLLLIKL